MSRLPPKGDPSRPLHLAVRSARLLGVASLLVGLAVVLALGYFNPYRPYRRHFIAIGTFIWFVPGVAYVLCSLLMAQSRRRRAATVGALLAAAAQGLFAAALLVVSATFPPVSPLPILLCVLWLAALAQLVMHLRQSLRWLRADAEQRPGFGVDVVTAPKPVLPIHENEVAK